LADDPSWRVGNAKVNDLALSDQIVQTTKNFFDRSGEIPRVQPKQIDIIRFEPAKAGFDRLHHRGD
jgi:hypothetical protein